MAEPEGGRQLRAFGGADAFDFRAAPSRCSGSKRLTSHIRRSVAARLRPRWRLPPRCGEGSRSARHRSARSRRGWPVFPAAGLRPASRGFLTAPASRQGILAAQRLEQFAQRFAQGRRANRGNDSARARASSASRFFDEIQRPSRSPTRGRHRPARRCSSAVTSSSFPSRTSAAQRSRSKSEADSSRVRTGRVSLPLRRSVPSVLPVSASSPRCRGSRRKSGKRCRSWRRNFSGA